MPTAAADPAPAVPAESGGTSGTTGESGTIDDGNCAGISYEPEQVPVDLYIMLDRTVSMVDHEVKVGGKMMTRWDAVKSAVESFVSNPKAANVGMGIGFFNASGGNNPTLDCDPTSYSTPKVEIGVVSKVGPSILEAINNTTPGGLTPTTPALQGAISHAREWAAKNLGRKTVVVLVTDGYPTSCEPDVDAIVKAAADGMSGSPAVATYVVGVDAGFNLNQIALAGGTSAAFNLEKSDDASQAFVDALLNITNSPIVCEYKISKPGDPDQAIDPDKISLFYTPKSSNTMEETPRVSDGSACANAPNGGWFFDNPSDPKKIRVCPCTCSRFGAGKIDLRIGCKARFGLT